MNEVPIRWRRAVMQDDVEAIQVIVSNCGVFSAEEIDVAVELAQDALANRGTSDYHFVLAERAGLVAGYTCFGRIPLTQERYDLYWIVVDAGTQQQGIASGLLKETEESVRELHGKALYAETSSRAVYTPAQGFYRKHGFAELARIPNFYSDGDDKLIYGKTL